MEDSVKACAKDILEQVENVHYSPEFSDLRIRNGCRGEIEYIINFIQQKYLSEEKPFITMCRDTAIKENLPLYFIYYEETGVFEVYITETKELFEKRHCAKHLPNYEFQEIVTNYLDSYSDWKGGNE